MVDLMDQFQHRIHHNFQALHVQDLPQEVLMTLVCFHGGIYMKTILDPVEMVLMVGKPIITLNFNQICYGNQALMKLLVINHQEVLDK